ncbi:MAG: HAMP domain-containing histidine kinase [Chloroflexi bacterium]|nr:HAMP domain-containing histidine kinase [Chloroflexota bacterium]
MRHHWKRGFYTTPRERPSWWPEAESWPPSAMHRWRRRRGAFMWRAAAFLLFVAFVPIAACIGTLWLLGVLQDPSASVSTAALAAVIFFGVALLGVAFAGLRRLAAPLGDLIEGAGQVEAGDFSTRVQPRGPRELRSLGRAFNNMAERLEVTETQRRHLVADLSHELRTPVSVIQGNLEGMLDGVYEADEAHLGPVLEEVRMLSRLIDDLSTLSEAESGTLELHREPTDLGILASDVAASFRPQADDQGVELKIDVPDDLPLLELDPVRIREVLVNLTTNALRHTPRGGNVTTHAVIVDGYAQVTVVDTGSGIAPEDLEHVFDRFYKSDSRKDAPGTIPERSSVGRSPDRSPLETGLGRTAPETSGSGLGLTIAKNLVAAHGGEISAESAPGKGTTVRFTLPIEPSFT